MRSIRKILKVMVWTFVWALALAVVLLLALPLWIGPVGKCVANAVTPGITKTDFNLGHLAFNPYSGHVEVGDMQLANPTNFTVKNALDLSSATLDVAPLSFFSDTYHVKEVAIDGMRIYLDAPDAANFVQIKNNVTGAKRADEPESSPVSATGAAEVTAPQASAASHEPAASAADETAAENAAPDTAGVKEKRIVIDRITVKNVVLQYGPVSVPLPEFAIRDIGRDPQTGAATGATWTEAGLAIAAQLLDHAQGLGKGLVKLSRKSVASLADATTNTVAAGLSAITNFTNSAVGDSGSVTGKVDKAVRKSMKRVLKETDKAVKFLNNFLDGLGPKSEK